MLKRPAPATERGVVFGDGAAAPAWLEALLRQLAAEAPADAVLLAPPDDPLAPVLRRRLPRTALIHFQEPPATRHALAIAARVLESLAPADARALLAALRDRVAPHVLVLLDLDRAPLDEAALRALAYRLHARDGAHALFGFDLHDYKDRPDWLGPQHWAHPQLWEKFRW
jgi:hypothetical protein